MNTEKNIKTRMQQKHDIEANWRKATNFIPKAGEIIVYDADENCSYPRIKIGDGISLVNDLSFNSLLYKEFSDPIVLDDENYRISYPDFNLIGSVVIDNAPGRGRMKNELPLPDKDEEITFVDLDNISLRYTTVQDMFNKKVFVMEDGGLSALLTRPDLVIPLMDNMQDIADAFFIYVYTNTIFMPLEKTLQPGWYCFVVDNYDNINIYPHNMEDFPMFFNVAFFAYSNDIDAYMINCVEPAENITYVITEENICTGGLVCPYNTLRLQQGIVNTGALGPWVGAFIIMPYAMSFMYSDGEFLYSGDRVESDTLLPRRSTVTIIPAVTKKIGKEHIDWIQSDYEQNDPAKPDYIKNRLAWSEIITNCLINPTLIKDTSDNLYKYAQIGPLGLKKGKQYRIEWSSADSSFTTQCMSTTFNGKELLYVGNASLYDASLPSTGHFAAVGEYADHSGFMIVSRQDKASVWIDEEIIHPISEKYILPSLEPFIEELGTSFEYLANEIASKENVINVEPSKIIVSDDNGKLCASETSLEDISMAQSALAPGSITWNRDLEGRTIFQAGEQDGMEYGYVKVSDAVFTPEQFQLLSYSGFKPILGAWVEDRYISWEAEIQKIDESVDIGYMVLPKDESEQLGAMILSSDFMGVTAGVYFAVVQDLGYAIAAVTNLQIPGYGHAQSQAISTHVENIEKIYTTDTLVWDGTNPDMTIDAVQFKRVADPIPMEVITNNKDSLLFYVNVGGEIVAEPHTPRIGENFCYFSYSGFFPALVITSEDNVTPTNMTISIPKAGTYFIGVPNYGYFGCALSIKDYMFTIAMNQAQSIIDNKHLPEHLQLGEIQEEYTIVEDMIVELGDTLLRTESIRLPYDRPSPSAYFAADYIDIKDDVIVTATNKDGTVITLTKDGNSYINGNLRYMVIISNPNETLIPTATDVKVAVPGVYLIENGYDSLVSVTAAGVNFTRTDKQFTKKIETKTKVLDEKYLPDLITVEDIDIICGMGGNS